MITLLIALYILLGAFLLGTQALALLRLSRSGEAPLPLAETTLFALGLGIVLMGYVVLALGLLGVLYRWLVLLVPLASGLLGVRQAPLLVDVVKRAAQALRGLTRPGPQRPLRAFLTVWALIVLLGALAPPIDSDYDGLSQHLASPRTYLRHHAIMPLWFDHHSHFPSTLQMLFTIALAGGSPEAGKLLHLGCGLLTALALIVIGRRFLTPAAGEWAAFAFLTVPLTGWLAQVAYVDLAGTLFAALLLLGFLLWERSQSLPHLLLAALAAGGGMAVKMQGLQLLLVAVLGVLIVAWRARLALRRSVSSLAAFAAVSSVVACPWYIKSVVWTGNPVYPFAYGLFGGKCWGPEQATPYQEHQLEFGVDSPPPPAERARMGLFQRAFSGPRSPRNLLLAPWNLAMRPGEFEVVSMSPIYATWATSIGPLFLALVPLLLLGRPPRPVAWSLGFGVVLWAGWLMLMQYNRYLLPALAVAAVPAGHVLADLLPPSSVARLAGRAVAWIWGAIALTYVLLGLLASVAWQASLGLAAREDYLRLHSECYRFAQWVNSQTSPAAKIALYSEPRGFYLDRDYLWAEQGHSRLIDYAHLHSGDDLLREFGRLGITHLLYCRLPGTPDIWSLPPIGPALAELRERGLVRVLGSPPYDPQYVLLAIGSGPPAEGAR